MKSANKLHEIMAERVITYRDLASKAGVRASAINKIANFNRCPTQDTMIAIARGLRMEVTEVFNLNY